MKNLCLGMLLVFFAAEVLRMLSRISGIQEIIVEWIMTINTFRKVLQKMLIIIRGRDVISLQMPEK